MTKKWRRLDHIKYVTSLKIIPVTLTLASEYVNNLPHPYNNNDARCWVTHAHWALKVTSASKKKSPRDQKEDVAVCAMAAVGGGGKPDGRDLQLGGPCHQDPRRPQPTGRLLQTWLQENNQLTFTSIYLSISLSFNLSTYIHSIYEEQIYLGLFLNVAQ